MAVHLADLERARPPPEEGERPGLVAVVGVAGPPPAARQPPPPDGPGHHQGGHRRHARARPQKVLPPEGPQRSGHAHYNPCGSACYLELSHRVMRSDSHLKRSDQ